jgi:hypothetical protein
MFNKNDVYIYIYMKKKIVILITGQKKRLELLSKKKYIISPLSEKYDVTVVLSLSDTENFTNKHKYKNFDYDLCEIEKEFDKIPYYINDIMYPTLNINSILVSMYDKQSLGNKFTEQRAKNHVRQYYTLYNSWTIIKKLDPDILIRIRDDALLSTPLQLTELSIVDTSPVSNNKLIPRIITPCKNSWGGINDKFAIVSKEAIETYLNKPFEVYNSYKKNDYKEIIKNPEQFLKNVYSNNGISLLVSDIEINIVGQ